jgi:hypothetical protein
MNRKKCQDYSTLGEIIAEREGEKARVRAINKELRRQYRAENLRRLSDLFLIATLILTLIALGVL